MAREDRREVGYCRNHEGVPFMSATVAMKVPNLAVDRNLIERLVRSALEKHLGSMPGQQTAEPGKPRIVANISARHVHLTPAHVEELFGPGHKLTPMKDLYQPGAFAAEEV